LEASRITWGSPVQGSARELLTDPSEGAEEAGQSSKDLPMMLWAELREGVAPSKQVEAALKACGYSAPQIRRAREKMGIRPEKGGMKDSWYWSLPAGFVPRPEWLECVKAAETSPEDDKKRPEDAEDAGAETLTSSAKAASS
ncbi:MAG: hypothetical protein KIG95_08670, partial [Comamonas sp.]|nr:hypothetical protein [Comamonas sp.]